MHQTHDETSITSICAQLISHYAYLNDERRFEELATLFTEDAVLYRPSAPEQPIVGRESILAAFRKRPADTLTFHVCSDVLIDVQDATLAHGRSRILMLSATRLQDGSAPPPPSTPPVPGVFRDVFRLTADGWKFAERRGCFWI